ncbi:MAG: pyridoxal phosphate-dependent aminotransferase [Bryobacteraceae bacterium]
MRKIAYMEWVKLRRPAKYEIGGSGVVRVHLDELPEAIDALELNDFNLYGYRPLLKQIAARYEVKTEQVVTTQGCSMANYLACAALVRGGDEVLVERPAYEPLLAIPRLLGAKVVRFDRPFRKGYVVDIQGLAAKLTGRTRLIVLTNMHNPSGVLLQQDELKEIGRLARKVNAYVLVDEVYLDFLFEQRPRSAVHLGSNFIVTSSLTKAYGLDGLRCGWILARAELAQTIWRLQDFFGVNGAIPAEKVSVAAFENIERFVKRTRSIIEANRPVVERFMRSHSDQLAWVPPDGGPVCFPKVVTGDGTELAELLRQEFDTGIIPGHFFEMPRHFRLGFGGPEGVLRQGLARLGKALPAKGRLRTSSPETQG